MVLIIKNIIIIHFGNNMLVPLNILSKISQSKIF